MIVAWLAEAPSGVLADRLGRKWLVIVALLLSGIGIGIQGIATTFSIFLIANILYLVGFSFHSGAAEALVYESLPSDDTEGKSNRDQAYEQVVAAGNSIQLVTHVISILFGTWAFNKFGDSAPFILQGVFYIFGATIGLWAVETKTTITHELGEEKFRVTAYEAAVETLQSFRLITGNLTAVAIVAFAALGLYDLCAWSFMRTAMATKFGFDHEGYAIIINLGIIGAAIAVRMLPIIRGAIGDNHGFPAVGAVLGVLFVTSAFNIGLGGSVALAAIIMVGNLLKPWSLVIINKSISDEHRATVISLFSFIARVQFLLLGVVVPYLAEKGYLSPTLLILGLLVMISVGASGTMGRLINARNCNDQD